MVCHQAEGQYSVAKALSPFLQEQVKAVTVNGSKMANFKELEEATGLKIYFCDPHSPWQRGANENCNGLLRQYFPRGTNFRNAKVYAVKRAVDLLNNRPRNRLLKLK